MQALKGYLFAIISAVSYGLIPLFILPIKKMNFSVDVTLFYRFFISALFLALILIYRKENFKINRQEFLVLLALGLFYGLSSDLLFMGYDQLTPGIASTILFVYPVIVALLMFFFFKEKLKLMSILSLFITLIGVIVLSAQGMNFNINLLGLFITLGSALFYALYIITVNQSKIKISGWKITFYSMLITSIYYLSKSIFLNESLQIHNIETIFNFVVFALVTTVLSLTSLVYAIKLIGSTPTSIMGALEPVVAVMVSVILFGENLTNNLILGVCLILVGVIINILSSKKKEISTE